MMIQNTPTALEQKANEFINTMFYGTLMRDFRRSQQNPYFDQGTAGRVFWQQFDTEVIRRMSQAQPSGLAKDLMKHLDSGAAHWRQVNEASGRAKSLLQHAEVRHG
jgi:Rod binding domain-containing protein